MATETITVYNTDDKKIAQYTRPSSGNLGPR